jgi:DNA-binding FadR family transcriptional regulator
MVQLKAVSRTTLGEQVALQLAEMIADEHWEPGEKLPPETALCSSLNVSRSTLREALKSLSFVGMVRMRPGDGTYVTHNSGRLLDRIMAKGLLKTEKDLADVCETRILIETELAALAAERATPADREHLRRIYAELEASLAGDGKPYVQVDYEFHLAIAEASHNVVLRRLITDIRSLLMEWIAKSQEMPEGRRNAHKQHTRILHSILDGHPEKARKEMRSHLEMLQKAYSLLSQMPSANSAPEATPKRSLDGTAKHP